MIKAAILSCAALLLGATVPPYDQTMVIFSKYTRDEPAWVAAEAAFTASGKPCIGMLGPRAASRLESYIQNRERRLGLAAAEASGGYCVGDPIDRRPVRDLDSLYRTSVALFEGTIREIIPGFYHGLPSSLLVVNVHRGLQEPAAFEASSGTLLVIYGQVTFTVRGRGFCGIVLDNKYVPRAGDRILLFPDQLATDSGRRLLEITSRRVFFETADNETEWMQTAPGMFRSELANRGFSSLNEFRASATATIRASFAAQLEEIDR